MSENGACGPGMPSWAAIIALILVLSAVASGVGVSAAVGGTNDSVGTQPAAIAGEMDGRPTAGMAGGITAQQGTPAGFSGTVSLSTADAKLSGVATNDTAGRSVAGAGDVNGDGVVDLLIGAPRNDSEDVNAGAAYLFYGPVDREAVSLADADVTFLGVDNGDWAGWSVASAGDLNGDGLDDVIIGAPQSDENGDNAGAAYVVYGNASLPDRMSLTDANVTMYGGDDDRAGWSVSNASAVGRDGRGVIVGAPTDDEGGHDAGAAFLVAADTIAAQESITLELMADAKLFGEAASDHAGSSVSWAGDINDDGTADVIVGAPRNDTAGSDSGAAYIVYGPVRGEMPLEAANVSMVGAAAGDRAGIAVAGAGDVNDDGTADVIVGAPMNDARGRNAGAAYLVFGSSSLSGTMSLSGADVALRGARPGDRAGRSVAAAGSGDVTCDTVDDVLIGAPGNDAGGTDAGAAYLVTGNRSLAGVKSLDRAEATFIGEAANDSAGSAVSGPGDLDDDGFDDILVGAPSNDSAAPGAGAAYVLFADCPTLPEEPEPVDLSTACDDEHGEIRLENENDETTIRIEIDGPSGYFRSVTLDPGEEETIDDLDDGDYVVRTFVDRRQIDRTTLEIDCDRPPEEPEPVDLSTACDDEQGQIRLANENDETTIRVEIDGPGRYGRIVTLDPGESRTLGDLDDGNYVVRTFVDRRQIDRTTLEIDCDRPPEEPDPVDVSTRCDGEQGQIRIENENDETMVRVEVRGPSGFGRTLSLDPGESRTLRGIDDGIYGIRTFVGGDRIGTETVEIDCDRPPEEPDPVDVSTRCVDGQGQIRITNENDATTIQVEIRGPDGYERSGELDPGESTTLGNLDDGNYDVRTVVGGEQIGTETVEIECDEPLEELTVRSLCDPGGGVIQVSNPNDEAVEVSVTGPGGPYTIEVDGNSRAELSGLDQDGEYSLRARTVGSRDDVPLNQSTVMIECGEEPTELAVQAECGPEGGSIQFVNQNDQVVVVRGSGPGGPYQFEIGPNAERTLTGLGNGEYSFRARIEETGEVVLSDEDVELDCPEPAGIDTRCRAGTGTIVATNPNDRPIFVDVAGPDDYENRTRVEAGGTVEFTGLENGAYTVVTLNAADENVFRIGGEAVEIDCEAERDPLQVEQACAEGGGDVTVTNPNEAPVFADLSGPGDYENRTRIAPGESITFTGLTDGSFTLVTLNAEDENVFRIGEETVEIDCGPAVDARAGIDATCGDTEDTVDLAISVSGDESVQQVTAQFDGQEQTAALNDEGEATIEGVDVEDVLDDDGMLSVTVYPGVDTSADPIGSTEIDVAALGCGEGSDSGADGNDEGTEPQPVDSEDEDPEGNDEDGESGGED